MPGGVYRVEEWKHTVTALSARVHIVPLFHVSVSIVYVFTLSSASWVAVTSIPRIDTRLLGLIARRLIWCKSTYLIIFTFSICGKGIRFWTDGTRYGVLTIFNLDRWRSWVFWWKLIVNVAWNEDVIRGSQKFVCGLGFISITEIWPGIRGRRYRKNNLNRQ